jgi:hypothetical protein
MRGVSRPHETPPRAAHFVELPEPRSDDRLPPSGKRVAFGCRQLRGRCPVAAHLPLGAAARDVSRRRSTSAFVSAHAGCSSLCALVKSPSLGGSVQPRGAPALTGRRLAASPRAAAESAQVFHVKHWRESRS